MSKNGQLPFLRIIELGGALSPRGSPPLGGALSPRGSPPLGGALRFCSVYETETSLLNLKA